MAKKTFSQFSIVLFPMRVANYVVSVLLAAVSSRTATGSDRTFKHGIEPGDTAVVQTLKSHGMHDDRIIAIDEERTSPSTMAEKFVVKGAENVMVKAGMEKKGLESQSQIADAWNNLAHMSWSALYHQLHDVELSNTLRKQKAKTTLNPDVSKKIKVIPEGAASPNAASSQSRLGNKQINLPSSEELIFYRGINKESKFSEKRSVDNVATVASNRHIKKLFALPQDQSIINNSKKVIAPALTADVSTSSQIPVQSHNMVVDNIAAALSTERSEKQSPIESARSSIQKQSHIDGQFSNSSMKKLDQTAANESKAHSTR